MIAFLNGFLGSIWRTIEPRGIIPEPYRIKGRITFRQAWGIASTCWRISK